MSRIITALILLPVLIASVLFTSLAWLFIALALVAMAFGLYEFWSLAKRCDLRPEIFIGSVSAAALFAAFVFDAPQRGPALLLLIIIALTVAALSAQMLRGVPFDQMLASSGATILGVLYVTVLGGHLVAVRTGFEQTRGAHLLSFFFLVIMGSDTGAYYTGRALGRHKLAPRVSPGKTWEGAAGGMLASLLLATLAHYWFFAELPLSVALLLAAAMNLLGVVGDLTESALKRGAGAKDAAQILPGHGGLLDRLDSLLFNAPLIYYFGRFYFH
jgi:phosphatidate cytidylyltransferase